MPSELHAVDGGTVSAPASNAAAAQLAHQQPPPAGETAAADGHDASSGVEPGKGERVDASA